MAIYNNEEDPNVEDWDKENGKDKITEALDYLESQGFYIRNTWHIQDVQDKFKCTEEEAFDVLDDAEFDYVIYNTGTIEDLIESVRVLLIKEGII